MGGAAGHLQHLYENLGLTFGEIKEVLASAAEGRLERVSEKLDGMNLVFTWADGQLKVARTSSDIKGGGMDAAGLAKKFFGRGNVEEAFNTAFKVLHQALGSLGDKVQHAVFKGGRRWYSMEIIYAASPNTINYDSNNIVFHGWPIFEVQKDGSVEQTDDDSGIDLLAKRIDQMQKAVTQRDWRVSGPSLLRLKKLSDGSILQKAIAQIDGAMTAGGVNEGDTVYDYLRNLFADDAKSLKLPPKAYKMVIERCATGSPPVNDIKKETPKELQATVQAYVKASDDLKARWMAPIESAIHFFAIEVLRGLHSTLIASSDEEVARLQQQLGRAIRTIQASGHEKAMEVLQKEMARLGSVENLAAAMEGIVFFFKGQAYKFTGAFAPAHQLMALFKYGRKDIPKMDLGEARRRLIAEGGGAFDVEPITLDDFEHVWPVLEADLEMLGCTDIEPIGSTGKKQVMGDVDVAARCEGGAAALYDAAARMFGQENVKKVGGSVISISYQQDVPAFQVDIMVGDPKYVRWGRAGAAGIKGHPDYSPVKGVGRNILLNVINRWVSEHAFPGRQTELDRERYAIDFDRGLFRVVQTKRNARDPAKPLKNWKDVERELVSDDPDKIVRLMFGPGTRASDLKSFDGVVRALRQSPRLKKHAEKILRTFADEMHELVAKTPDMLGDSPEEVLAYIDRVALGEAHVIDGDILLEKALTPRSMTDRPWRFGKMLQMVQDGVPFTLSPAGGTASGGAGQATIRPTPALVRALENQDAQALEAALAGVAYTTEDGEERKGLRLSHFEKTADLGGKGKTSEMGWGQNELAVANAVNAAIERAGHPVIVAFGDYEIFGVTSAEHVGARGKKADVVLHLDNGKDVKVSIKGKRAMFYQTGDRALAPILAPVVDALEDGVPPEPRFQQKPDKEWQTVVGPENAPRPKNVKFPVEKDAAERAVFGRGTDNEADIVVHGDLTSPKVDDYVITWPNAEVAKTVDELPEPDQPEGLLQNLAHRHTRTPDGRDYVGVLPMVATKRRTRAAAPIKGL